MKCVKCEGERYPFEIACSGCLHKQFMLNMKSLEQHLTKMFSRMGIDYNEFKETVEGQTI